MSSVYADVIVDITNEKLDRTFQYKVPPELTGEISPGTAVQIPFGNGNRTITGYVRNVGFFLIFASINFIIVLY